MPNAPHGCVLAVATLLLAAPAIAQGTAPQPGPAPAPPLASPLAPNLVGTWSGLATSPGSHGRQAEQYGADGRFTAAGRRSDGIPYRVWGTWRGVSAGPDRLRVEVLVEGWLPREVCTAGGVGPSRCQATRLPASDTSLVTFDGPDRMRSTSETRPGSEATETRDDDPALLRETVPERWTFPLVPNRFALECNDLQQQRFCAFSSGRLERWKDGCLACVTE